MKELGILFNCIMCDSAFVVVFAVLPTRINQQQLEEQLSSWRRQLRPYSVEKEDQLHFLHPRCPHCTQLVHETNFKTWLASSNPPIFCPCRVMTFGINDDDLPIFVNVGKEKDKWQLFAGHGPNTLQLDTSQSGRVHKKPLHQFAPDTVPAPVSWDAEQWTSSFYQFAITETTNALLHPDVRSHQHAITWWRKRPLFKAWDAVCKDISDWSLTFTTDFDYLSFEDPPLWSLPKDIRKQSQNNNNQNNKNQNNNNQNNKNQNNNNQNNKNQNNNNQNNNNQNNNQNNNNQNNK